MTDIMASHGAAAMGGAASPLTRLGAWLAAWQSRRSLSRLDARQRRDFGLPQPAAAQVDVQPGWDVGLLGLR
ncbi:DUF1127 domain-containing protein [Roseicyclus persicicus]|uniref:DUF1127 domain-containing protein n=1 Tax=Roseicyclus persicicus TaxID=2650661 RepID=A0A7X6GZ64_9RHOB|nr:DUF1127 domain-containing protein [Roseibacterium persicicum]NKX44389.1 DUF1127 domain-containing protein [Roseibacterium persicicum]